MNDEIVQLVDEDNVPCGVAPRSRMRAEGLLHRATFLFVFLTDGRLFVQKRAASKDLYPSYFDACDGGVVRAGESYADNAVREAVEELGISLVAPEPVVDFLFQDIGNCVWGRIFKIAHDAPIEFADDEIELGEFVALEDLSHERWQPLTPDSRAVLNELLDALGQPPLS